LLVDIIGCIYKNCLLGDFDACMAAGSVGVGVRAAVGVAIDDLEALDVHGIGTASTLVVVNGM